MRVRALIAAAASIACLTAAPAAAAPPAMDVSTTHISSGDGTQLLTQVFRPAGLPAGARTPVIVLAGPYFGTQQYVSPDYGTVPYYKSFFDRAIPAGYTIVQVTLRGYGGSGGCSDFKGAGEQADAAAAVEWAASQPFSDGRVGMYGLSYDAATQVMALGRRPRGLKAVVPVAPGTSAYGVMFMNGVRYVPFAETFEAHNSAFWVPPPSVLSGAEGFPDVLTQLLSDPLCLAARLPEEQNPDRGTAFWRARELADFAAGSSVPVFYSQGFLDANAHSDGFLPLWQGLRGPRRAWLGQYPHVIPGEVDPFTGQEQGVGRDGYLDEVMRFLDRHVKGDGPGGTTAEDPPVEVQDGGTGRWRAEADWPPSDAQATELSLLGGSYADAPGNKGEPYCYRVEGNCVPGPNGVGSWTLSQPLPHDAWISGVPALRATLATAAPGAHLVGLLYDIDEDGDAALISRGARLLGAGTSVGLQLYPQDWRLRAGHRIGVLLSGADDGWFAPGTSLATVTIQSGAIEVPFLRYERTSYLEGGPSTAMGQRSTFRIDPQVLAGRVKTQPLPPPLVTRPGTPVAAPGCQSKSRLKLRVRPRRVATGRRVRLRVRVRLRTCGPVAGKPASAAVVRLEGHRVRLGAKGRATISILFRRPGRHRLTAVFQGSRRGRAVVIARG